MYPQKQYMGTVIREKLAKRLNCPLFLLAVVQLYRTPGITLKPPLGVALSRFASFITRGGFLWWYGGSRIPAIKRNVILEFATITTAGGVGVVVGVMTAGGDRGPMGGIWHTWHTYLGRTGVVRSGERTLLRSGGLALLLLDSLALLLPWWLALLVPELRAPPSVPGPQTVAGAGLAAGAGVTRVAVAGASIAAAGS